MPILALKIDIDTYTGIKSGLPNILDVLEKKDLPASFFISFGPDRSGLAVFQLLRPRFFLKMIRTNAAGIYGLKTALYGTLLKPPMIGLSFPKELHRIKQAGHETACHAWDHRLWQDWLPCMSRRSVAAWLAKMTKAYMDIFGTMPECFGAPGWRMDKRVLDILRSFNFSYLSCTRAREPFIFEENSLLEIPSNLPCIEEAGVAGVMKELESRSNSPMHQVLPVHTEVEGGIYLKEFQKILDHARLLGYKFVKVSDIASSMTREDLKVRGLDIGLIPGRAFKCAL